MRTKHEVLKVFSFFFFLHTLNQIKVEDRYVFLVLGLQTVINKNQFCLSPHTVHMRTVFRNVSLVAGTTGYIF